MTSVQAALAAAGARPAPARRLLRAAVAALTTMRDTLAVLTRLAGMIIRQSRAARRDGARQRARR